MWKHQSKNWKWPWLVGFERFEQCWPLWSLWGICYTSCFLKLGHQTLNCTSVRYNLPAKISPALPLFQKNCFCGKVRLDDFYRLLYSKSSNWIHIGLKRISQVCCLHHLEIMEKNCKTQLWDGKQNRALVLDHPVFQLFNLNKNYHILLSSCSIFLNTKSNVVTNLKPFNWVNNCISLVLIAVSVSLSCSSGLKEFKISSLKVLA